MIYKRPDSIYWWMALEREGHTVDELGVRRKLKPLRESTGVLVAAPTPQQRKDQETLAQQVYLARMADMIRKRIGVEPERETISFRAYADWYLEHISPTKRNLARERSMMKPLVSFFGARQLHELTKELAIEWRTWRARTGRRKRKDGTLVDLAPNTVNREMILLRSMMTKAVPRYLPANPFSGIAELHADDLEVRLLEFDEEDRLYEVANSEDAALITTALDTLMRLTSVASILRAQDHGSYFTVLNPKVKTYKVPISARVRERIDALPKAGPAIFAGYNEPGITDGSRRNRVIRNFQEICRKADVRYGREAGGITFHSLRHTGASRMLAAGVDIKTVMVLGGWTNLDVLQRYLHPTDEMKRRAVELISARQVEQVVAA